MMNYERGTGAMRDRPSDDAEGLDVRAGEDLD